MKQTKFWKESKDTKHGGSYAKGKRKSARPVVTKSPMHLMFRSSRARGSWNFLRKPRAIEEKARALAKKYRVRVFHYTNVGNHLHFTVQAASRRELQSFLRVLPQAIAFLVTGTRKGKPIGRFWDHLAFSRVVAWGKDKYRMANYHEKNRLEAQGEERDRVDYLYKLLWDSG